MACQRNDAINKDEAFQVFALHQVESMTMFWKSGVAALAVLAIGMTSARAQDLGAKIYRLGDTSAFASERPDGTDEDTQLVAYRGGYRGGSYGGGHYAGYRGGSYGGGHYAGYRGGYGGYRGGYYGGHHGGYRNAYYGPRYGFGFGYPYYARSYYGYSQPAYYYSAPPVYYYYPSYSYCPISLNSTPVYSGSVGVGYPPAQGAAPPPPMRRADEGFGVPPPPPEEQGTFPYNGGPGAPVPLPGLEPLPQKAPAIDPAQGRVVSIPAKLPKYLYSAYGQKPATDSAVADRPVLVKDDVIKAVRR